jgi:hypothetical protein
MASAREIAQQRFASGEIDEVELKRILAALGTDNDGRTASSKAVADITASVRSLPKPVVQASYAVGGILIAFAVIGFFSRQEGLTGFARTCNGSAEVCDCVVERLNKAIGLFDMMPFVGRLQTEQDGRDIVRAAIAQCSRR